MSSAATTSSTACGSPTARARLAAAVERGRAARRARRRDAAAAARAGLHTVGVALPCIVRATLLDCTSPTVTSPNEADDAKALATRVVMLGSRGSLAQAAGGDDDDGAGRRRTADDLLGPRGGARRAALRAVHQRDRHRGRGPVRDSAELAATIAEEGDTRPPTSSSRRTPGSLGAVRRGQLAELPDRALDRVDERFRDRDGRWVGTRGRARVIAYNTDELAEERAAGHGLRLHRAEWKGRIGIAPTNASFQAFVTAMRLTVGEERDARMARGARGERRPRSTRRTRRSSRRSPRRDRGRARQPLLPLPRQGGAAGRAGREPLPRGDDPVRSSTSQASGVAQADRRRRAPSVRRVPALRRGSAFYVEEAEEAEYPLVAGIEPSDGLPPLDELAGAGRRARRSARARETLELLNETGWTT